MLSGQAAASCHASMDEVRGGHRGEPDDEDNGDDDDDDDDDAGNGGGDKEGNGNADDDGGNGGMGMTSVDPSPPPTCISVDLSTFESGVFLDNSALFSALRENVNAPMDGKVRCKGIHTVTTSVPSIIMYPFGPSSQCHRVALLPGARDNALS